MDCTVEVLYEDNHLIVVNKKSGQIVQGDKTGDTPLSELVKAYIAEKYQKSGKVYLGVVHRIDRPTSGVVLFARTSKAAARLSEMFRERRVDKTYWAIVKKQATLLSGTITNYLKKNARQNKSHVSRQPAPGYKEARMKYLEVARSKDYVLLEVKIFTGRHHQIRAQLASEGMPVKGDLKYGAPRSNPDGSISLHARQLTFRHPVKKVPIQITAPIPEDSLWQILATVASQKDAENDNNFC